MADAGAMEQIEKAKADGIRFVQLQFTDILGIVKAVTIPIHQMADSVSHGTWFDGSSIEGFTRIAESDQYLMPDMATFAEIPWQPGDGPRGTARVICDVFTPRGEPFAGDPATSSAARCERARKLGYVVNMGPELEFFLFRRDEAGKVAPLPHDLAGYFDFSTDLAQEVRQDMVDALEAFGISGRGGPSRGRGRPARDRLRVLRRPQDRRQRAHLQVRPQGDRPAPRPLRHVHAQAHLRDQRLGDAHPPEPLLDRGGPQRLRRPANRYGLSDLARSYMAGILAHAKGMAAVLAPTVNSYKRLVPGYEAPTYITWGRTNRSALIRVPMISPGKSIEGTRAEVRCPDPSSNTYLAFAVMIAAGLDGVERGLALSDPVEESLFEMDAAQVMERGIAELPGTLGQAIDELKADAVVCEALGDHVLEHYVEAKTAEWDEYRTQVTQWELDRYLEAF